MARATWSGSISFGLVSVPVKLYPATRPQTVHFNQLEEKTGARVRYQKVSDETGKELDNDEIVKGYELASGKYVTFTDDELDALAPEGTRSIDIEDFVDIGDIDPMHFDTAYWAAPSGDGASKPYALLAQAMEASGRIGVGRFVMHTKQHLAAIRPVDGSLTVETMLFPDEVVAAKDIDGLPSRAKVTGKELKAAQQLIESLTDDWKPSRYHDTHREELLDRIERKAKGDDITTEPGTQDNGGAEVLDLMAALEASVAAQRKGTRRGSSTRPSARSGTRKATKRKASKATTSKKGTTRRSAKKKAAGKRTTKRKAS